MVKASIYDKKPWDRYPGWIPSFLVFFKIEYMDTLGKSNLGILQQVAQKLPYCSGLLYPGTGSEALKFEFSSI